MKKRTIAIAAAVAVLSAAVLIVSQTSVAYLMDTEAADNIIQIGQVSVELKEESFPTTEQTVEAGRKINKNPKLSNNGKNDEYVFFKVEVPKENVTLLYEDTTTIAPIHNEGEKIKDEPSNIEIFKILANSPNSALIKSDDPEYVFNYHQGVSTGTTKDGWIILGTNPPESVTVDGKNYSRYIFGYNKKLKVGAETVTLFDQVQLKSFIDGEVAGNEEKEENVKVTAYAIQADDLGLGDAVDTNDDAFLDVTALGKIWTVVSNKSMTTG